MRYGVGKRAMEGPSWEDLSSLQAATFLPSSPVSWPLMFLPPAECSPVKAMTMSHHSKCPEAPLSDQVLPGVILIRTLVTFYQHGGRGERGTETEDTGLSGEEEAVSTASQAPPGKASKVMGLEDT